MKITIEETSGPMSARIERLARAYGLLVETEDSEGKPVLTIDGSEKSILDALYEAVLPR